MADSSPRHLFADPPMTPQELLDRIPTVQELLEHPRVRQTAERWNRSTMAARLRAAIADVGAEVARRAEPWQGKTAGDLIDDLLRRVDLATDARPTAAINATGQLFCDHLIGPPLPDAAVEAVAGFSAGYRSRDERVGVQVASLVGAEAAWVGANHAAAVSACLETFARDRPLVVARHDMGRLRGGVRLEAVCRASGVAPREVGVAEGATPSDYEQQLADAGAAVVYVRCREAGDALRAIADVVHERGGLLIADVGEAAPIDLNEHYGLGSLSAAWAVGAGADLVTLCGDGLLGGPESTVVFGCRALVDELSDGAPAASRAASAPVGAMVEATASLFRDPGRLKFSHPLYELISAPLENLRTRAERLAPQIAEHARVDAAEAVLLAAGQGNAFGAVSGQESWGIEVSSPGGAVVREQQNLAEKDPAIACEVAGDRLRLDLRTVFPRQDAALVDAMA